MGILDGVGFKPKHHFPIRSEEDGQWIPTINYWKEFNHIEVKDMYSDEYPTGIAGDTNVEFSERFLDQAWYSEDTGEDLYHFITAARMPHAVDLREVEYGWNLVKRYRRLSDGSSVKE